MPRERVWLPLVATRIVAVSGTGIGAAIGILLLLGGFWLPGLIAVAVALLFVGLMFLVERQAERNQNL